MEIEFTFFDRQHDGKHEYGWTCRSPAIPRAGDEVSLPGLDGGGPLWNHEDRTQATLYADHAIVESVVWRPTEVTDGDDVPDEDMEVSIYCAINWESMDV